MIPYGHQSITQKEIDAVVETLKSGWLTQGPKISEFEQALASQFDVPYVISCSNGTAALHLACMALGLGDGDILWTSPNSYVASANCALYCGASVDFVDINPQSRNLSIEKLEEKLKFAKKKGKLPKVLVAVHFAGMPCDMQSIYNLSREYNFYVIEDAAHAMGSSFLGSPIGQCRFSHVTTFSFHPVKTLTTAEGGAIATKDDEIAERLRFLANHGVTRDEENFKNKSDGPWNYEQQLLGFNYRMNDLQAALGLVQLSRLQDFIVRREEIFQTYLQKLKSLPIKLVSNAEHKAMSVAWHLFAIELDKSLDRKKIFEYMRFKGVGVNVHYKPVYLNPFYRELGFKPGLCPAAEAYYRGAMTLPIFPDLSYTEQDLIIEQLDEAIACNGEL